MEQTTANRILDAAIAIARYAPKKKGQYVHKAGIAWTLIDELRASLDEAIIEWEPRR